MQVWTMASARADTGAAGRYALLAFRRNSPIVGNTRQPPDRDAHVFLAACLGDPGACLAAKRCSDISTVISKQSLSLCVGREEFAGALHPYPALFHASKHAFGLMLISVGISTLYLWWRYL